MSADPKPATHDYRVSPRSDGWQGRRLLSDKLQARLERQLSDTIAAALTRLDLMPDGGSRELGAWAGEFFRIHADSPAGDNPGGSGVNDSLWLFVLARALRPARIVESGTHRGHSAWILHRACPDTPIDSFDVDTGKLTWSHAQLQVHAGDWTQTIQPDPANAEALVFFDDHINHARRVVEAHARGFRWMLVDDNFAATQVHATGGPPLPSLDMLFDPEVVPGDEIAWSRGGKDYAWTYTEAAEHGARDLIESYEPLPELGGITRFPAGSGLSLVRLKAPRAASQP
ncbi:hypothetical protein CKO28_05620 [Rhodovibrio sodomensis]|uniref:Class I SAM-dependent methyltransferase n=1 Tax=Rhodovibrio sodomensis TaxID=1088 RepID=A0ABS1DCP1_9PROT|nr:hypothetical protein [Rhodovibrio sodomensis]MBK1667508.1 hypothetical protein [Rhodovibrio sodomensis]